MIYDYIIIGTGPSGSILASDLAKKGNKIALVDRATDLQKTSNRNSFIYSPYINNSPFNYAPLFSNQLGGNSALWNNKIYLLSKDEFNTEDWGFSYKELQKYSRILSKKLNVDHDNINKIYLKNKFYYSKSYRAHKLGNIFHYLNISADYNIDIFSHSSPTKIIVDNKKKIKSIVIKDISINKHIKLDVSKAVIFCAGGLGNPHILQNLLKKYNKNIGKNLCDHPHINIGSFNNQAIKQSISFSKYFFNKKNNTEKNLYFKKNNNFSGIQLDLSGDATRLIKKIYCKINRIIPKFFLQFSIKYYSLFVRALYKFLIFFSFKEKYSYEFFFSQKKNIKNSVNINKKTKDQFNNFKSDINWAISKDDVFQYNEFIAKLIGTKGSFIKNDKKYLFSDKRILSGLHPSCTTQIASNKKNGVVDKNLKMFDYKNIYICGSSVFKLNGFTNPTWTIMTMASRLATYLSNKH